MIKDLLMKCTFVVLCILAAAAILEFGITVLHAGIAKVRMHVAICYAYIYA